MTNDDVYSSDDTDEEIVFRLRDRVTDKRIEKKNKQAEARKHTKKGTRNEQIILTIGSITTAERTVRASGKHQMIRRTAVS